MVRTIRTITMAVVLVAAATACKDDPSPCDSTSHLEGSSCMPNTDAAAPTPDTAPSGTLDGPVAALDTDNGEATGSTTSLLGQPCTDNVTHAECQGPDTNYCAVQPGTPGYCTKSGCVTNADCPPNWTCFDLSKMGITGYPAMCTKPKS